MPNTAKITSVALEGGTLVAKKPITLDVTVHGGSSKGTYALSVIMAGIERGTLAAEWQTQNYNETIPANVDTAFSLPTPWLWSGSADDFVPYHFEVRLSKTTSSETLSTVVIEWHSIGFRKTYPA